MRKPSETATSDSIGGDSRAPILRKAGVLAVVAAAVRLLGSLLPAHPLEETGRLAESPLDFVVWTEVGLIAWAGSRLLVNRWIGVASGSLLMFGIVSILGSVRTYTWSWAMFPGWEPPSVGLILVVAAAGMMIAAGVIGLRHSRPAAARRVGLLPRVLILTGTVFWVAASVTPVWYLDHQPGFGARGPQTIEGVTVPIEDLRRLLPGGEPEAPADDASVFDSVVGENLLEPFLEEPFERVPLLADPLLWDVIYVLAVAVVLAAGGLQARSHTGMLTGAVGAVGAIKMATFMSVLFLGAVPETGVTIRLGAGLPLVLAAGVLLLAGALLRSRVLREHATSQPTGDGDG